MPERVDRVEHRAQVAQPSRANVRGFESNQNTRGMEIRMYDEH
jgi:hypothetical protein